jgi:hypothetical protein
LPSPPASISPTRRWARPAGDAAGRQQQCRALDMPAIEIEKILEGGFAHECGIQ